MYQRMEGYIFLFWLIVSYLEVLAALRCITELFLLSASQLGGIDAIEGHFYG